MSFLLGPDPRRIEEIFDAVCDLDPDSAARRLDEVCAGDRELRAAVEGLLEYDRAAPRDLLSPSPAMIAEALREAHADRTTVPNVDDGAEATRDPAQLGRFFVLRRLGEGGMGVVYVGYDEVLDRRVAVKLLRRGPGGAALLLREAQALARLAHPNVVAVHEVGEHEGRVFLAMELVVGQSLRDWLAEKPRTIEEILGVFLQAGRGLDAAHEAGLVHRDFKPENVLVGDDGRVRVVDFGIAALAESADEVSCANRSDPSPERSPNALSGPLTQTGRLIGTPAFMAPERFRGERATPSSDQFSFCVALYRAAYGAAPFPGEDVGALITSILEGPARPPPPQPGVPAWLWPIVSRGLSIDPTARFPSMGALLSAIDARMPRGSDLDRLAVRRERLQLLGLCSVSVLGFGTYIATHEGEQALLGRWTMVEFAVVAVVAVASVIFILRRKLLQNHYGRRLAALLITPLFAWLAHRLIAVRLGTPPLHVLTVDLVLWGTVYATAGITFERWMGWIAVLSLAGAAVSAYAPVVSPGAVLVVNLTTILIAVLYWRREG